MWHGSGLGSATLILDLILKVFSNLNDSIYTRWAALLGFDSLSLRTARSVAASHIILAALLYESLLELPEEVPVCLLAAQNSLAARQFCYAAFKDAF